MAEVNAEGKVSSTSTQRIKLTLNPALTSPDGATQQPGSSTATPSLVSVYVGGEAAGGER